MGCPATRPRKQVELVNDSAITMVSMTAPGPVTDRTENVEARHKLTRPCLPGQLILGGRLTTLHPSTEADSARRVRLRPGLLEARRKDEGAAVGRLLRTHLALTIRRTRKSATIPSALRVSAARACFVDR